MTESHTASPCPSCSEPLPAEASFCPSCGHRLVSGETIELPQPVVAPPQGEVAVHEAHRRVLGLPPVSLLAAALAAQLLLTIVLFATGGWVGGLVLLAIAAFTAPLFVQAARREPESHLGRRALAAGGRARAGSRVALAAACAWSAAGFELGRLAVRRMRLRMAIRRQLAPLGQAVHHGDEQRAAQLRAGAERLEHELHELTARRELVIRGARRRVERRRSEPDGPRRRRQVVPVRLRTNSSSRSSSSA